jgi:hypothetical protein
LREKIGKKTNRKKGGPHERKEWTIRSGKVGRRKIGKSAHMKERNG